jgi:hypothetical protein
MKRALAYVALLLLLGAFAQSGTAYAPQQQGLLLSGNWQWYEEVERRQLTAWNQNGFFPIRWQAYIH